MHATQALRFAIVVHVVNWVVALSPISAKMAPVTNVLWVAVPFIVLIALMMLVLARRFTVWTGALALVASANLTALCTILLDNQGIALRVGSPMFVTFLVSAVVLPLTAMVVVNHLAPATASDEDWQPGSSEVVA